MQVDISFDFAKVFDITKVVVVKGQKFSLFTDFDGESKWFTDNDPVLSLTVDGNNAELQATDVGSSTILIMNASFAILKQVTIRIVDAITEPVKDLGIVADPPVLKT